MVHKNQYGYSILMDRPIALPLVWYDWNKCW